MDCPICNRLMVPVMEFCAIREGEQPKIIIVVECLCGHTTNVEIDDPAYDDPPHERQEGEG